MKSVKPYIIDRSHLHTRKAILAKLEDDSITILEIEIMNRLYELILTNIYRSIDHEIKYPAEIYKD